MGGGADNEDASSSITTGRETVRSKVTKELKQFCKTVQLGPKDDPMGWWASNRIQFPVLAQVAERVLDIPASCAPTERLFSKLARVNAKDRCRMKPGEVSLGLELTVALSETSQGLGGCHFDLTSL